MGAGRGSGRQKDPVDGCADGQNPEWPFHAPGVGGHLRLGVAAAELPRTEHQVL